MDAMLLGVKLMGFGLTSVFVVLVSFIIMIKLLTKVFPYEESEERHT